MGNGQ